MVTTNFFGNRKETFRIQSPGVDNLGGLREVRNVENKFCLSSRAESVSNRSYLLVFQSSQGHSVLVLAR